MKFQIFALFFLMHALMGRAKADDKMYLYLECSQGQQCINLAHVDGNTESVQATPALVLGKADFKTASVKMEDARLPQSLTEEQLNVELSKEAAKEFEEITGANIGKKLMVVFDTCLHGSVMVTALRQIRRLLYCRIVDAKFQQTSDLQRMYC